MAEMVMWCFNQVINLPNVQNYMRVSWKRAGKRMIESFFINMEKCKGVKYQFITL